MISLLKKFLYTSPSIILPYDHLTADNLDAFEEQVTEIGKYYRWGKLSELSPPDKKKCTPGMAALVFENARKSVFLRAIPWLEEKKIPFTLGVRTDCIGMNQLPWPDEESLYQKFHAVEVTEADRKRAWEDPEWGESQRQNWRKLGPLPLNEADPTFFFVTWGQIFKISPQLMEVAMYFNQSPSHVDWLTTEKKFIETQTNRTIHSALSPYPCGSEKTIISQAGISTVVALSEFGPIEKNAQKLVLPRFELISEGFDKKSPGDSL